MRRFLKILFGIFVTMAVIAVIAVVALHRAVRHEPKFYQQVLQDNVLDQELAADALEQSVMELHNDASDEGTWEAVFTDDQLNGWLASELPEEYPQLLPPGTKEPRVLLSPENARVACRYERGNVNTVISMALRVELTEQTNQLAIRASKLRAGVLPVPLKRFLGRITLAAERSDLELTWSQVEGDPVALITIPIQHEDYAHGEIYLDVVELRDGEIYLSGRTEKADDKLLASAPNYKDGEKRAVQ